MRQRGVTPLTLLLAWQALRNEDHILTPITQGNWTQVVTWSLSALICGFFWEMWNSHSQVKWFYTIPYVQRFHLFEMPLLGYAGYLPFGLECAMVTHWFNSKPLTWPLRQRDVTGVLIFCLMISIFPRWWCGRQAEDWYSGGKVLQKRMAHSVGKWIQQDLDRNHFTTGSRLFDGEWLFGTYMMAGMGFGQTAIQNPELTDQHLKWMERCIDQMLSSEVREFDREMWGNDPLETLSDNYHHAAYLGYLNLLLGMYRYLKPNSKYSYLNDQITESLIQRLQKSPIHLIQSYPNETYPMDNCAVIGSIGIHHRITHASHNSFLRDWSQKCRSKYIEPQSGLLYQAVDSCTGSPSDLPRGSGTTFGSYFLSFADPEFSHELFLACQRELPASFLGFAGMREYPRHVFPESGDIDSGPVLLGIGISPTGFMLAGCRIHHDPELFKRLYRTAHLFGAPIHHQETLEFVTGGPLGNAIMFGMLTALPTEKWKETP